MHIYIYVYIYVYIYIQMRPNLTLGPHLILTQCWLGDLLEALLMQCWPGDLMPCWPGGDCREFNRASIGHQ